MKGLYGGHVMKRKRRVQLIFRDGALGQVRLTVLKSALDSYQFGSLGQGVSLASAGQGLVRFYLTDHSESTLVIETGALKTELAKRR